MYNVEALYGPPNSNGDSSDAQAYGLNTSGDVGGVAFPDFNELGVIWSGGILTFTMPMKSESLLFSINNTDQCVGAQGTNNSPTQHAILVRNNAVTDLAPLVGEGSMATHINDEGLVCGWGWNNPQAFVYDSGSNKVTAWIPPLPDGKMAVATAINNISQVAGLSDDKAFLFKSGTLTSLGPAAFVMKINNAGVVCGSVGKPFPQNFAPAICDTTQPAPKFVEIPIPAGFIGAHAEGINNLGDVVGTCWTEATYDISPSAYIYHGGISTDLNTLITSGGWHLEFAEDINDAGQITGIGTFSGEPSAFLLTPQNIFSRKLLTLPELVAIIFGGIDRDGGGWELIGRHFHHIGPWGPWATINAAKRDALVALAMDEIGMFILDRGAREKVRNTLIEVARERLEALKERSSEGRVGVTARRQVGTRIQRIRTGKPAAALRRFPSAGMSLQN